MILNIYAVRDEVAKIFKYDFKRSRHGEALRFFGDSVQQKDTELAQHPSDFTLFFLGTYDNETGRFVSLDVPERLASAFDFVNETTNHV